MKNQLGEAATSAEREPTQVEEVCNRLSAVIGRLGLANEHIADDLMRISGTWPVEAKESLGAPDSDGVLPMIFAQLNTLEDLIDDLNLLQRRLAKI